MNYVHRLAKEYRDAGISVIPLRMDGSKAPHSNLLPQVCDVKTRKQSGTWEPFTHRLATDEELDRWFAQEIGIGMVGGAVSGGLEIFDFDDGSLFAPWHKQVAAIVDRLPVVETPSGGWHVLFRCNEFGGNCKIAKDPRKQDKKTLIETRGEGGYIVAEGSPCKTHATGLPYAQYSGPPLPTVPRITPDERRQLWAAARTFDRQPEKVRQRLREGALGARPAASLTVHPAISEFNYRMSWARILEPHGWTSSDGLTWARPGKSSFVKSAGVFTANDGNEVLVVWSGNAGALAPESGDKKTWNKFYAWTALNFNGDSSAAIAAARREVAA